MNFNESPDNENHDNKAQAAAQPIMEEHAGAKSTQYPASTLQILGAEKALFRALKAKSDKSPKYGLIYHSEFEGSNGGEKKGKMAKILEQIKKNAIEQNIE